MSVSDQHVSRRLRAQADLAMSAKKDLMTRWARDGVPVCVGSEHPKQLEWYPTSLRSFSAWDGSQNSAAVRECEPLLRKTAFQTLKSNASLHLAINQLLRQLEVTAEACRRALNPELAVEDAKEKAEVERAKRAGALLGYRQARAEVRTARRDLGAEKRAHQGTLGLLREKERELAQAHEQIAALTKTLRKTTSLKSVR